MPKTADEIFQEKIDFLIGGEQELKKKVNSHQRKMFELIASEYLPLFELTDGFISDSPKNLALIQKLDSVFDKLENALYKDVLGLFAQHILKGVSMSGEYYIGLGFEKTVVNSLIKDKIFMEKRIGITPKGKVKKNGYLYRLGRTDEVRNILRDYVTKSLTGDISFYQFQLGMRNLVIGNRRKKALDVDGALQRHFDTYAYDAYNQLDATANKQFAQGLNLHHFIYTGSLIATSRNFCAKRAGKAFTVEETKQWKNDPDLIDKKTKNSYRPLIELGRNRCRHFAKYITEETYKAIKNAA